MSSNGLRKHRLSAAGGLAALTLALTALGGGHAFAAPQDDTAGATTGSGPLTRADEGILAARGGTGPILIKNASGKCLEIEGSSSTNGARAQQWTCNGQSGAVWRLDPVKDKPGLFHIKNVHNGKCLEIENSSHKNGANAQLWSCNEQAGAEWEFWVGKDEKTVWFKNTSGKWLEIEGSSSKNGARAQQWTDNGQSGARWTIWG
ncbi:RICIN domain-containing protein [Kitasatospora sp. RG8]|uniref:RICIN domain-containing protein n=1 Tax=Kitasatospora sp. RG8 TaxID=2820815 RepID=UPI001ADFDCC2|nr:RICIN domain-containing protein [Kitasatospora sp. RG8]MBP0451175.1 RICIN domain-containing protein [Kitasatospora sp. RG8]